MVRFIGRCDALNIIKVNRCIGSGLFLICFPSLQNHQSLQRRYAAFSEEYDQLHTKSQEIITTLQQERDKKIVECEELTAQVSFFTKTYLNISACYWRSIYMYVTSREVLTGINAQLTTVNVVRGPAVRAGSVLSLDMWS